METPGHRRQSPLFRIAFALPVLLLFAPDLLLAQGNCVSITRAGEEKLSTLPGRIVTTALSVSNLSPVERRLESRLEIPPGWRNLTPDIPFGLAGNRTDVRLLSIAVPAATPPGSYQVRYELTDNAIPPCRTDLTFDVSVESLRRIDLQLQDAPRYVVSGASCRATFLLRNLGNGKSAVRLSVRGGDQIGAVPDSAEVTLRALESRPVSVVVTAAPQIPENVRYVLELRALLAQDTTVAVTASCLLEIIPRVTATDVQFHEVPLELKLRAAGESGHTGGQIEVAGGGTVTDRGTDRVDLLVRTPDIQSRSILGLHDEYRFSYLSERYRAFAGDMAYELSPLTELARYAFGCEGQFTSGAVTAGGFVNQTRFYSPPQREQAGFVNYGFGPGTAVGVNFLRREDFQVGNVATLRGLVRPVEGTDVELEYGMSSLDGAHDDAYEARVLGSQRWISYDVRVIHAGPDYGGYYRNVDFRSAAVNARPWGNLRIEAFAQDERRNLLDDTLQLVAPRDRYYQFGAGWGELLSVYYREVDEKDLLPVPKFDRRESSVQIRSGYSLPFGNVYGSAELGSSTEYLLQNSGPLRRYQLAANFRPEEHQTYGFTASYEKEQNLYSGGQMETWSGSLNAAVTIASRTRILASLYGTRVGPPYAQTYSLVDISVEYQFPFRHTLALRGRESLFSPSSEGQQTAFLVEYSIPLSIPLTRLSGSGELRGKVVDASTGAGVENVVLYAGGATAVTDESGEFLFPSLKPDVYALTPDLASAGVDRVTTRPVPFLVTVLGGEESRLDIGVVRSAAVSGVISVYDFRDAQGADSIRGEMLQAGKGSNILVELDGEDDTLRRFSDNRGRFQFADLRPGDWILHVSGENLPEYHYLERDSVRLRVIPGGRSEVALRVLPRRRKVQILQEGNIGRDAQPPRVSPPPGKKGQDVVPGKPAPSRRKLKPRASLRGSSFLYCASVGSLRLSCVLRQDIHFFSD